MIDSLLLPPSDQPSPEDSGSPTGATGRPGAVVVGVDDGPLPWGLLEHALHLAVRRSSAVRLVHVHRPESPPASWFDDAAARVADYLARQAAVR